MEKLNVTVITHYPTDDPDCGGDYANIDIVDAKGKTIAAYGDYYHDKGQEKVQGFLDALRYLKLLGKVKEKNVADVEWL